jgi:hypothetical protein
VRGKGRAVITTAHRMESLSRAYLQAVAAQAGLSYSVANHDYGIDVTLREVEQVGPQYADTGRSIDVQLKSTTGAILTDTEVRYDLEVRTYDYLRDERPAAHRLLVLFVMPDEEVDWVSQTEDAFCLRRCIYWVRLRGRSAVETTATTRISIPRQNVLTAAALIDLLASPIPGGG